MSNYCAGCWNRRRRHGKASKPWPFLPQCLLHCDHVQPAVEFKAHFAHRAHLGEAEAGVQADGAGVFRITNHGKHLGKALAGGVREESGHDGFANTLAAHGVADIDAVFGGEAVGGAVTQLRVIAKAEHAGGVAGYQPAPAGLGDCLVAAGELFEGGGRFLEGASAIEHMVGVDSLAILKVSGCCGRDDHASDLHPKRAVESPAPRKACDWYARNIINFIPA